MSQEETKPRRDFWLEVKNEYHADQISGYFTNWPRTSGVIRAREVGAGLVPIEDVRELVEALELAEYFWFTSENRAHPNFPKDYRCDCTICRNSIALANFFAKYPEAEG